MMNAQPDTDIETRRKKATPLEYTLLRLRAAIEEGRLPPGVRLPEEKLARALNASRARVREVLALLANERLVDLQANRGAFVARPTIADALHKCEARLMAEKAMARLAADRASPRDLKIMRDLLDRERAAWDTNDVRTAVNLSRNFHRAIADAAGNPVLAHILTSLLSRSALTQAVYAARGAAGCLCHDHVALLDAIAAGDADRAETVMAEHVQNMIDRLDLEPLLQDVDIEDALRNTF